MGISTLKQSGLPSLKSYAPPPHQSMAFWYFLYAAFSRKSRPLRFFGPYAAFYAVKLQMAPRRAIS